MGMTWTNLSNEELCDLMCGKPEDEEWDKPHKPRVYAEHKGIAHVKKI